MLLRETYSTLQDESRWKKEWEGPGIEALPLFLLSATTKCGVAILCTNNQDKVKATYRNSCKVGRHLLIKIETESLSFTITNIYATNIPRKRKTFFQKLVT